MSSLEGDEDIIEFTSEVLNTDAVSYPSSDSDLRVRKNVSWDVIWAFGRPSCDEAGSLKVVGIW